MCFPCIFLTTLHFWCNSIFLQQEGRQQPPGTLESSAKKKSRRIFFIENSLKIYFTLHCPIWVLFLNISYYLSNIKDIFVGYYMIDDRKRFAIFNLCWKFSKMTRSHSRRHLCFGFDLFLPREPWVF